MPGTDEHPTTMVIGRVVGMHIDDALIVDGLVDPTLLQPLCRLGYQHYAMVSEVFRMDVPQ